MDYLLNLSLLTNIHILICIELKFKSALFSNKDCDVLVRPVENLSKW